MRFTYPGLRRHENAFRRWSGVSVAEFDALYQRFEPAWVQAERVRLHGRERQRALGGGGDYALDLDTRLLMLLIWLRHYLTGETLADLFGVSQSTVSRTLSRLLPVLQQLAVAHLHEPLPPAQHRTLAQLQQEQPDLFAIFDATEQSVNRPHDDAQARLHFSGKQRRPTCKTTLHVNEDGLIRQLSATQPGSLHDVTHLRQSGLLAHVPQAAIAVADSAYVGLYKDLPDHSVLVPHKATRGHPLLPDHKLANRELAAIRIKVENVLAQLKIFRILSHRFRHSVAVVHTQVFSIIAALYNWRTLNRLTQARLGA
jgi:hypothetical protein